MKFGTSVLNAMINKEFKNAHRNDSCEGEWEVVVLENVPYSLNSSGMVFLKQAPFAKCHECAAMFYVPGFEDWIQKLIALDLINSGHLLTKPQLRFLRKLAGLTQRELAEEMNINVKDFCKFESANDQTRFLSEERQIRVKLKFARYLGLQSEVDAYDIADRIDESLASFPQSIDEEIPQRYIAEA